jgi:hypothetical protein
MECRGGTAAIPPPRFQVGRLVKLQKHMYT